MSAKRKVRQRGKPLLQAVTRDGDDNSIVPPKAAIRLEFGRRLRKAMQEKGVRQIDIANGTDIGRDNISGYARGRVLPEGDRLKRICEFLGTTPEKLIPHYGVDMQAADTMPAMEIKQAEQAGKVWIRVNQVVSMETASRIMELLRSPQS